MKTFEFNQAEFLISAAQYQQFPEDTGKEVAFVGRSNSGKSSALNTLTNNKRLARTSKTPGRTQLINFFNLDEQHRLVDLPGYGFAQAPIEAQKKWIALINHYMSFRQSLAGLVVLMDIRHPLTKLDIQMLEWTMPRELPVHILLSKCDKLPFGKQKTTLLEVKKQIKDMPNLTLQLFSSMNKIGLDELKKQLLTWLND